MNRTLMGRITLLRGIRHQIETFLRQATELGSWKTIAAPVLAVVFIKSYQQEQANMQAERVRALKEEKEAFDRADVQLAREISAKAPSEAVTRRVLPRRVRRADRA